MIRFPQILSVFQSIPHETHTRQNQSSVLFQSTLLRRTPTSACTLAGLILSSRGETLHYRGYFKRYNSILPLHGERRIHQTTWISGGEINPLSSREDDYSYGVVMSSIIHLLTGETPLFDTKMTGGFNPPPLTERHIKLITYINSLLVHSSSRGDMEYRACRYGSDFNPLSRET